MKNIVLLYRLMGTYKTEISACGDLGSNLRQSMGYMMNKLELRNIPINNSTGYGLGGPGIKYRWGRDFPLPSRQVLGPTQPPINGYRVFPGGKVAGAWR
jgi:hypothetical protein